MSFINQPNEYVPTPRSWFKKKTRLRPVFLFNPSRCLESDKTLFPVFDVLLLNPYQKYKAEFFNNMEQINKQIRCKSKQNVINASTISRNSFEINQLKACSISCDKQVRKGAHSVIFSLLRSSHTRDYGGSKKKQFLLLALWVLNIY